jgi:hypothetical protein
MNSKACQETECINRISMRYGDRTILQTFIVSFHTAENNGL